MAQNASKWSLIKFLSLLRSMLAQRPSLTYDVSPLRGAGGTSSLNVLPSNRAARAQNRVPMPAQICAQCPSQQSSCVRGTGLYWFSKEQAILVKQDKNCWRQSQTIFNQQNAPRLVQKMSLTKKLNPPEAKPGDFKSQRYSQIGFEYIGVELDETCQKQSQTIFNHKKQSQNGLECLEVELDLKLEPPEAKSGHFQSLKDFQNSLECL